MFGVSGVGMFPLMLSVLNRDYNPGGGGTIMLIKECWYKAGTSRHLITNLKSE